MTWSSKPEFAPFPHPRRDPHLGKARRAASLFLAVISAGWLGAITLALQWGTEFTFSFLLLGIAGVFIILSRMSLVAETAMAWTDSAAGIEFAPPRGEIIRRFLIGAGAPLLILALGFAGHQSDAIVLLAIGAIILAEMIFKLGPYSHWQEGQVHPAVLKSLLLGELDKAADALESAGNIDPKSLETTCLGLSGMAIRRKRPDLHGRLITWLGNRPAGNGEDQTITERLRAVITADRERIDQPDSAPAVEAEALRIVPAGHPRRLPLALFVATAALDRGEPDGAIKALSLLHSRDVTASAGRILVNWLLLESARQAGEAGLEAACREALADFRVRRLAGALTIDESHAAGDAYDRWLRKAKLSLEQWGSDSANPPA